MGAHISKITFRARHLSAQTPKDYVNTFNRFIVFLGEDLLIEDISHKQIETSEVGNAIKVKFAVEGDA